MGWILRDYECTECPNIYEQLVDRENQNSVCPACYAINAPVLSPVASANYSMMSKDEQAKCLRKRSREHTIKQIKKDPTAIKQTRIKK